MRSLIRHSAPENRDDSERALSDTHLSRLQHADLAQSLWQIGNSFVPYVLISAILYTVPDLAWWAKPVLWVLAAGFVVRIFIIQHDCGHGSFFKSRRANEVVGWVTSVITMAPYAQWRRHHGLHHANWNNLDRRDSGLDIYSTCLTVDEYADLSALEQRRYRLMRNPAVSLLLLPPIVFLVLYRVPFDSPDSWRKERAGVHLTNLGILSLLLVLAFLLVLGGCYRPRSQLRSSPRRLVSGCFHCSTASRIRYGRARPIGPPPTPRSKAVLI